MENDATIRQWLDDGIIDPSKDDDSLSLDSVRKSLAYIDQFNQLRKVEGLNELKVSDYLMATAAASNQKIQSNGFQHTGASRWDASENIAYGSSDSYNPFNGWYTREKALFDQAAAQDPKLAAHRNDAYWVSTQTQYKDLWKKTGHYLNIVDGNESSTGFAWGASLDNQGLYIKYFTAHQPRGQGEDDRRHDVRPAARRIRNAASAGCEGRGRRGQGGIRRAGQGRRGRQCRFGEGTDAQGTAEPAGNAGAGGPEPERGPGQGAAGIGRVARAPPRRRIAAAGGSGTRGPSRKGIRAGQTGCRQQGRRGHGQGRRTGGGGQEGLGSQSPGRRGGRAGRQGGTQRARRPEGA
ncbi:hypothetical protein KIH81_00675 [Bifidobacterium sp. 82T25]|nr:hypothetical protein [Bifidobacterium miconisargentati]